jgi:large subunit ribosomal protein L30
MASPSNATQTVLRITLVRSLLGNTLRHKATVRSLGLRKMHQTVEMVDSPQLRGMVAKVAHMVRVEEITK